MSAVVDFLNGQGVDGRGRTLAQVLAFDDAALERHHDFIQWLFPLPEPSGAVPESPVLSPEDVAAIRSSEGAQAALAASSRRMLDFYRGNEIWRGPADHNHLRITRIIRSLRLLVGDVEANAFRASILELADGAPISETSRTYWAAA